MHTAYKKWNYDRGKRCAKCGCPGHAGTLCDDLITVTDATHVLCLLHTIGYAASVHEGDDGFIRYTMSESQRIKVWNVPKFQRKLRKIGLEIFEMSYPYSRSPEYVDDFIFAKIGAERRWIKAPTELK